MLGLLLGAALLAHASSASCTQGTCEEANVTLLQRQLLLEAQPPAALGLVQERQVLRHQLAACTRQALSQSHVAAYVAKGPAESLAPAAVCTITGSSIRRDSGEAAAGPFRVLDDEVAKALAEEPPNKAVALLCLGMIGANVVFNRELTFVMNRSTHTMEHIVYLLKRYPYDAELQFALLSAVAGDASSCCPELTPFVVRIGGLDVLFAALDNFKDNPDVMMSAWRGLSDHSHNAFGAGIIANHGGPMKGVHFVVEQLRTHPEPYLAESPIDHLTLKYEIMQIVNGMLEHDDDNTYGAAFMREGLPQQMLYSMRVEPDMRGTQEVACDCMIPLLRRDPTAAKVFEEAGAVPLLVAAVNRFHNKGDDTPWCGTTLGASYPVVPACSSVLELLGTARPTAVDEMLELGLLASLNEVLPQLEYSVEPLRALLRRPPGSR
mmetsp:Transcript_5617/g.13107  ORF Transcript_5617/g.13107 Transcript_5617/m.13107 type:complete len:436 (-) Transcript_5617:86-1393(-)